MEKLWAITEPNSEEIIGAFFDRKVMENFKQVMPYSQLKQIENFPELPYEVKGPRKKYGAFESKNLAYFAVELDKRHKLLVYPNIKEQN